MYIQRYALFISLQYFFNQSLRLADTFFITYSIQGVSLYKFISLIRSRLKSYIQERYFVMAHVIYPQIPQFKLYFFDSFFIYSVFWSTTSHFFTFIILKDYLQLSGLEQYKIDLFYYEACYFYINKVQSKYCLMKKINLLRLALLLVVCLCTYAKLTEELSQSTIANNQSWGKIQIQLNQLIQFNCTMGGLSQQSLLKILSIQFTKLKILRFNQYQQDRKQILTPKLIKAIFTSRYFKNLQILNLISANLDNKYFQFLNQLQEPIISNLISLPLSLNYLSKQGFKSLSRINFQGKLNALLVRDNLLIEPQAVDAILKIICKFQDGKCVTSLKQLDISSTQISRQGFIKIMNHINGSALSFLIMDKLTLTYYNQYSEGLNYTAFQALAKSDLTNLTTLSIQDSFVDDQVAQLFSNISMPALKVLDLSKNQITDLGIKKWLTKKNMPNLTSLILLQTLVSDQVLKHLASQQFKFKMLHLGDFLTSKNQDYFSLLDTSQLQRLKLKKLSAPSKHIVKLFEGKKLKKLKQLQFIENDKLTDIFESLPWKDLESLQTLHFEQCDIGKGYLSLAKMVISNKTIQSIKKLTLKQTKIGSQNVFLQVLVVINRIFPNLEQLVLYEGTRQLVGYVSIQLLDELQFKKIIKIQTVGLTLIKKGQKYDILSTKQPLLLFFPKDSGLQQYLDLNPIKNIIKNIKGKYSLSEMDDLTINSRSSADIFFRILDELNIRQLPSLINLSLRFQIEIDDFLDLISTFKFPRLQNLEIHIIIPSNKQIQDSVKLLSKFIQQFKLLKIFKFDFEVLNEQKDDSQRKSLLDSFYFPFLKEIQVFQQQIQLRQMQQFIRKHNNTLRSLDLDKSFSEQGLFKLLSSSNIVLDQLYISSIQFTVEQFVNYAKVNTQFITSFQANAAGLTDEHIVKMIQRKSQIAKNLTSFLFHNNTDDSSSFKFVFMPNLQYFSIASNSIKQQGLKLWFSTGINNLNVFLIQENNNPGYINQLLRYPNRIKLLVANRIQIYGIQQNLNKQAARKIFAVDLETQSLQSVDYEHLASMNFYSLRQILLNIHEVYQCQVLRSILKMAKYAKTIAITFSNEKKGLNGRCLQGDSFEGSFLNLQNIFIRDKYRTTMIPQFFSHLFNSSLSLTILDLQGTILPAQTIKLMLSSQFKELVFLQLVDLSIGDQLLSIFSNKQLPQLQVLVMKNANLTSVSLKRILQFDFNYLLVLDLQSNDFSQELQFEFKQNQLEFMNLNRCSLPSSFLKMLNREKMENLVQLDLQYNQFSGRDIVQFLTNIQRKMLPYLSSINLRGIQVSRSVYQDIKQLAQNKLIRLQFDMPRSLTKINHASY